MNMLKACFIPVHLLILFSHAASAQGVAQPVLPSSLFPGNLHSCCSVSALGAARPCNCGSLKGQWMDFAWAASDARGCEGSHHGCYHLPYRCRRRWAWGQAWCSSCLLTLPCVTTPTEQWAMALSGVYLCGFGLHRVPPELRLSDRRSPPCEQGAALGKDQVTSPSSTEMAHVWTEGSFKLYKLPFSHPWVMLWVKLPRYPSQWDSQLCPPCGVAREGVWSSHQPSLSIPCCLPFGSLLSAWGADHFLPIWECFWIAPETAVCW